MNKYLLYFAIASVFFASSSNVFSNNNSARYTLPESFGFIRFKNNTEFENIYRKQGKNKYPILIQAFPLLGDGVFYNVLFVTIPSDSFQYKFTYATENDDFNELNKKYLAQGFTLISHQKVVVMVGQINQAVWIKK